MKHIELHEYLEEFSNELCDALNRCRDGDDFSYLVEECVDLNKGVLSCFQVAEIKRAIRLAVSGSYSHLVEGDRLETRKMIWCYVEAALKEAA
ncbi:MAG: hypothetical protein G8D91_09205 [gamma proteobacterium symbiont of Clathrolucina costata]